MSIRLHKHEHPKLLRVAAVGCGGHAVRNVLPCLQYCPVEFVATCDLDEVLARSAAASFGAERTYADYRRMLEKERPDAVLAVLNYDEQGKPRYPKVAIDAMEAGSDVWIEKPPASSTDEIEQMIETSLRTGKNVMVGLKKMFAPANVKAQAIVSRQEFGAVRTITARYPQPLPPYADRNDPWKMLGFLDHMVHPYSLLLLLGGPIASIRVERHDPSGASYTSIRFRNGALGSLHLAADWPGFAPLERTEIVGEQQAVVVDNNLRVTYYRKGGPPGAYGLTPAYYGPDDSAPLVWEPEFSLGQLYNKGIFMLGYVPEVLHFAEMCLQSLPPAKGTLEDALHILRIYEAYKKPDGHTHEID